jgi:hypothetical protein
LHAPKRNHNHHHNHNHNHNHQVAAKKLNRRLSALGASPLLDAGLGDDQVSVRCVLCCAWYVVSRGAGHPTS